MYARPELSRESNQLAFAEQLREDWMLAHRTETKEVENWSGRLETA